MPTILACTDGSTYALSLYQHTAWAAKRLAAGVEVLHVLDHHRERAPGVDLSGSIGSDISWKKPPPSCGAEVTRSSPTPLTATRTA